MLPGLSGGHFNQPGKSANQWPGWLAGVGGGSPSSFGSVALAGRRVPDSPYSRMSPSLPSQCHTFPWPRRT